MEICAKCRVIKDDSDVVEIDERIYCRSCNPYSPGTNRIKHKSSNNFRKMVDRVVGWVQMGQKGV